MFRSVSLKCEAAGPTPHLKSSEIIDLPVDRRFGQIKCCQLPVVLTASGHLTQRSRRNLTLELKQQFFTCLLLQCLKKYTVQREYVLFFFSFSLFFFFQPKTFINACYTLFWCMLIFFSSFLQTETCTVNIDVHNFCLKKKQKITIKSFDCSIVVLSKKEKKSLKNCNFFFVFLYCLSKKIVSSPGYFF